MDDDARTNKEISPTDEIVLKNSHQESERARVRVKHEREIFIVDQLNLNLEAISRGSSFFSVGQPV